MFSTPRALLSWPSETRANQVDAIPTWGPFVSALYRIRNCSPKRVSLRHQNSTSPALSTALHTCWCLLGDHCHRLHNHNARVCFSCSSSSTTTLVDQAAQEKQRKSQQACEAAGWAFQPFVSDAYGALRAYARRFISRFISRYHHKFYPLDEAEPAQAMWTTIPVAAVSCVCQ